MRIIRDDNNDDHEHNHDHEHGPNRRPASESDAAAMAETLVDEAEAFLAGLAQANPHQPESEPKPVARLVKSLTGEPAPQVPVEDDNLLPALRPQPAPELAQAGRRMPRWARRALPGSVLVVAVAVAVTHGQPAAVAIPIDIYAGAWVGFLFWNAAHRPPLREVAEATVTGVIGLLGAVLALFAHGIRALVTGIGTRRDRFETTRTAH
ncbi:hypothetical protein ACFVVM_03750 [Nocardia sp. NPDC058176]|uniref:hypothetical protein n=1 Tax=Nocardia sp. NPDC058176 TaxID=3346368 RepID=UPI0036DF83DE